MHQKDNFFQNFACGLRFASNEQLKISLDPEKPKIPPDPEAKGERAVASEHVNKYIFIHKQRMFDD